METINEEIEEVKNEEGREEYSNEVIEEKERTSHWVKTPQAVKRIDKKLGQNDYYLDNDNNGYLRHELLKV